MFSTGSWLKQLRRPHMMWHHDIGRMRRFCAVMCMPITLTVLVGCQAQYVNYAAYIDRPSIERAAADYRIDSPDVLHVRSRIVREIDNQRVTVQPDGTIALPLLGRIEAAGMNPAELAAAIRVRADTYYIRPDIDVRVARHASKHVHVHGAVAHAGPQPYNARNTALAALAAAQPTRNGDPTRIAILTPTDEGQYRQRAALNLDHLISPEHDRAGDVLLHPGEIVYVRGFTATPPVPASLHDHDAAPPRAANRHARHVAQHDGPTDAP